MRLSAPPFRDPMVDRASGLMTRSWEQWLTELQRVLASAPALGTFAGDPNGDVPGVPGDLITNTAGGAGTTLYVKESGAGTTAGWVAK